jgi:hypothetical protein
LLPIRKFETVSVFSVFRVLKDVVSGAKRRDQTMDGARLKGEQRAHLSYPEFAVNIEDFNDRKRTFNRLDAAGFPLLHVCAPKFRIAEYNYELWNLV